MTTAAESAMGLAVTWNSQTVNGPRNVTGPNQSMEMIDATEYASTGNYREWIASFLDGGQVTIECHYKYDDTNGQVAMCTDFAARTARTLTITLANVGTSTISGTAYITGIDGPVGAMDGAIIITFTCRFTGAVTITP